MNITFRTDASIEIGTGHVMRCLTLARALRGAGADCKFITRAHLGNMANRIASEGFELSVLPAPTGPVALGPPSHAHWAGLDWTQDAAETRAVLTGATGLLVVDHYAFDARWHRAVVLTGTRLMVIDDLADRPHACDLLLDQNLGRKYSDYDGLVPDECTRLIGPQFALLRQEFQQLRLVGSTRHRGSSVSRILVTMGGIDSRNNVRDVLEALCLCELSIGVQVTVVMGANAPYLGQIQARLHLFPFGVEVLVDVDDMAQLMTRCDLAITASGMITYELACMGIPMLLLPVSDIQRRVAREVARIAQAHVAEDWLSDPVVQIASEIKTCLRDLENQKSVDTSSRNLITGMGAFEVLRSIMAVCIV